MSTYTHKRRNPSSSTLYDSQVWYVHKFGGTSVSNPDCYRKVLDVMRSEGESNGMKAIVVSAMRGVTDALLQLCALAANGDEYGVKLAELKARVVNNSNELLRHDADRQQQNLIEINDDFERLTVLLSAAFMTRYASANTRDYVSGLGEVWSAKVLCAYMQSLGHRTIFCDAVDVLIVEPTGEKDSNVPLVDWKRSRSKMSHWLSLNHRGVTEYTVITGYRAATKDGLTTTLKRNGSDFSATIFGALLEADTVTIWTDVDGVFTADPRIVPTAMLLQAMTYDEAVEMAYFGAKVLYPPTVAPAVDNSIPVYIRNTFNATCKGTRIHVPAGAMRPAEMALAGVSVMEQTCLFRVDGAFSFHGAHNTFARLFSGLREEDIPVQLISQGSSRQSICFVVAAADRMRTLETLQRIFYREIELNEMTSIQVTEDCAIITAVGEGLSENQEITSRFFAALGDTGTPVLSVARGSSACTLSAVIPRAHAVKSVQAVHARFYRPRAAMAVGLLGAAGRMAGSMLLAHLSQQQVALEAEGHGVRITALADEHRMLLISHKQNQSSADFATLEQRLYEEGIPFDLATFVAHLQSHPLPNRTIIDASRSTAYAANYPQWMRSRINVITCNTVALSVSADEHALAMNLANSSRLEILYNSTICPGIPLIGAIDEMREGGNQLLTVRAVFSSIWSYVLGRYEGSNALALMHAAVARHPVFDLDEELSGRDSARRLAIIANELHLNFTPDKVNVALQWPEGLDITPSEAPSQPSQPSRLAPNRSALNISGDIAATEQLAEEIKAQNAAKLELKQKLIIELERKLTELYATNPGSVLRFVAELDVVSARATVGIQALTRDDPLARATEGDCVICVRSKRYPRPIILQGPGNDQTVTAEGLLQELVRLARLVHE